MDCNGFGFLGSGPLRSTNMKTCLGVVFTLLLASAPTSVYACRGFMCSLIVPIDPQLGDELDRLHDSVGRPLDHFQEEGKGIPAPCEEAKKIGPRALTPPAPWPAPEC
jgi:hypothetical protein